MRAEKLYTNLLYRVELRPREVVAICTAIRAYPVGSLTEVDGPFHLLHEFRRMLEKETDHPDCGEA